MNDDSAVNFSSTFYTVLKNTQNGVATIDIIRQGGTSNACTVDFLHHDQRHGHPVTDYTPDQWDRDLQSGRFGQDVPDSHQQQRLGGRNQTVGLALTNAVNTLLFAPSNATLTIIDTTAAAGLVGFSAANYTVNSTDPNAAVTVLRTNGSVGSATVYYATVPGTAVPGADYNPSAARSPLAMATPQQDHSRAAGEQSSGATPGELLHGAVDEFNERRDADQSDEHHRHHPQ